MVMKTKSVYLLGFFVAISQRSFVDTAPTSEIDKINPGIKEDASVAELENLRRPLGRTLSIMKTQTGRYSNVNGNQEVHSTKAEEVKQDRQLIAKLFQRMDTDTVAPDKGGQPRTRVRSEIEIPPEGIKSIVQQFPADYSGPLENNNQESSNLNLPQESENRMISSNNVFDMVQEYEPLDMAEYVFWTGDERSVSSTIEDLLQKGIMTREEAIIFLQQIKYNLDYLKSHYNQNTVGSKALLPIVKEKSPFNTNVITEKPNSSRERNDKQIRADLNELKQLRELNKKRNGEGTAAIYLTGSNLQKTQGPIDKTATEYNQKELLERLRLADFLYTEYSLEEVIYHLAKMILTQSLTGGSTQAQIALTKFVNFLEKEAEEGHISRALEKKVLDVLIASLIDTVNEHPKLLEFRKDLVKQNNVEEQLFRQIMEFSPNGKIKNTIDSDFEFPKGQTSRNSQMSNTFQMRN